MQTSRVTGLSPHQAPNLFSHFSSLSIFDLKDLSLSHLLFFGLFFNPVNIFSIPFNTPSQFALFLPICFTRSCIFAPFSPHYSSTYIVLQHPSTLLCLSLLSLLFLFFFRCSEYSNTEPLTSDGDTLKTQGLQSASLTPALLLLSGFVSSHYLARDFVE